MTQKMKASGDGYIFIYKFDKDFTDNDSFIPKEIKDNFDGGFGAVIYAHYKESPIGEYSELLFIPGRFNINGETRYIITKAYSSTEESVSAGYFTSKSLANFKMETVGDDCDFISANIDGKPIFNVQIQPWGVGLPISNELVNFPLMHHNNGKTLLWDYEGSGTMKFARIDSMEVRPSRFPDIAQFTPLIGVRLTDFTLNFEQK